MSLLSLACCAIVYDYYDSTATGIISKELQVSFGLPFKVLDREVGSSEQITLLLTNQPRHAKL